MQSISHIEPFELKGQWWRPGGRELVEEFREAPKSSNMTLEEGFAHLQSERDLLEGTDSGHACRGPLHFDPDSGLRLSLLGSSEIAFPHDDSSFPIHGVTTKGVRCSLLDCFVTNSQSNFPSGFADRELFAHIFVGGLHIDSADSFVLDQLIVRIPGLVDFLWAPVHDERGAAHGGLGRSEPEEHVVQLDSAEVSFSVGEKRSHTIHASTQERDAIVRIALREPISLHEWLARWVEPLVRLVIFATRQPTVVDTLTAPVEVEKERDPEPEGRGSRRYPVQIVQSQRRLTHPPKSRWERLLVSYASLGSEFDSFIARWWDMHDRLAGAGDFLFGVLRESMSLEPQLVTLASVIEGYHRAFHDRLEIDSDEHDAITEQMLSAVERDDRRELYRRRLRHANDPAQHDRVLEVIRRAGDVVEPLQKKPGRLATAVTTTRNYFVHLAEKDSRVLEGSSLYAANQLLILAVQCNLLLDLDVSREQALAGVKRAYSGTPFFRELFRRNAAWPKLPQASDSRA